VLASWAKGNSYLEAGVIAELDGTADPKQFHAALAQYEAMLQQMELLDEVLGEMQAIDKGATTREPLFDKALEKLLAEGAPYERLDLRRARYANAGGAKSKAKAPPLKTFADILSAQRDDLGILRKKLTDVIASLRDAMPIAEKGEFVPVMLSGRNGFADKMPEFTDLLSSYDRFRTRVCMATIDATMQVYPKGYDWLKKPSKP